jgi:hypothetical protein
MPDESALQVNRNVRVSLNLTAQVSDKLRWVVSFQCIRQILRESAEMIVAFHQVNRKTLFHECKGGGHPGEPSTDHERALHHGIGGFQERLQILRAGY